jgi:hypothetical protein
VNPWSAPSVAGCWRIWPWMDCAKRSRGTGPQRGCVPCCQNCVDSSSSGASVRCANTNVAISSASRCSASRISWCFSVVQVLKLTPKGDLPQPLRSAGAITRRVSESPVPLSFEQQQVWLLAQQTLRYGLYDYFCRAADA